MLISDRRRIDGRLFFELADPPVASAVVITPGTAATASVPLDSVVDVPEVDAGLSFFDDDDDDDDEEAIAEAAAADALAESTVTGF